MIYFSRLVKSLTTDFLLESSLSFSRLFISLKQWSQQLTYSLKHSEIQSEKQLHGVLGFWGFGV